ncbi:uncharacterized protein LOC142627207 [Castanea sativa]|uniref:uncharacterized protein LOC142627207 n=1 Tax=Castanea sativa TaxID=21020 RepID=UPI003F65241F
MQLDLYKGLGLKPEDTRRYDIPLVGFDRKTVIPKGIIILAVQTGNELVEVDFIVFDAYSPYTVILARPWPHEIGEISSTLHMKVKYLTKERVKELLGCQTMVRQCMVAVVRHQARQVNPPSPGLAS